MGIECTICYEDLKSSEAIYHTPCGHVFHHACLTQWFERSKTCPECRQNVAETAIKRIYLHYSPDSADDLLASHQTEIAGLNHELLVKELEIIESNSNNAKLTALLKVKEIKIARLMHAYRMAQQTITVGNSNNAKLTAMLKEKESEIAKLMHAYQMDKYTITVRNSIAEGVQKNLDAAREEIVELKKEKEELINSSKAHWDEISRLFDGIEDRDILVNMISIMKGQVCTKKLMQNMDEIIRYRSVLYEMERSKVRQMADNIAILEIEKIVLQKKIDDLELKLNINNGTSRSAMLIRAIDQVDEYISVQSKKLKTLTTIDCTNGNASNSGGPIDVIDLTKEIVQPVIDLTDTDTIELPVVNEVNVSWPLAS